MRSLRPFQEKRRGFVGIPPIHPEAFVEEGSDPAKLRVVRPEVPKRSQVDGSGEWGDVLRLWENRLGLKSRHPLPLR